MSDTDQFTFQDDEPDGPDAPLPDEVVFMRQLEREREEAPEEEREMTGAEKDAAKLPPGINSLDELSFRDFNAWRNGDPLPDYEAARKSGGAKAAHEAETAFWRDKALKDAPASEASVADMVATKEAGVAFGMARHADFQAVVSNAEITEAMAYAMATAGGVEGVADVGYYLGKHPAISEEIAALGETEQVQRIGEIHRKLSTPPKRRHTKAPAPLKTVGNSRVTPQKSPNDMSYNEFVKWRNRVEGTNHV